MDSLGSPVINVVRLNIIINAFIHCAIAIGINQRVQRIQYIRE